jgi:protein phosphatase
MTGAAVIELPDPSLVVLVGAAGAGKSTFAARHFGPDEILSSDAFREVIAGDAADQAATRPAFSVLHRALQRRLAAGRLTVVDATSVKAAARRSLVNRAVAAGVPAIAIVLDLPPATVHARNAARAGRSVPADAVDRQLADLEASIASGGIETEGFAAICRLADPAVIDSVVVRRAPAR